MMVATQNFGVLPTKNRQQGTVDGWEKIQGEELTKRFRIKKSACYGYPIGCVRKAKADITFVHSVHGARARKEIDRASFIAYPSQV
jgi:aldehyde:ferredoxin oxidoreductase